MRRDTSDETDRDSGGLEGALADGGAAPPASFPFVPVGEVARHGPGEPAAHYAAHLSARPATPSRASDGVRAGDGSRPDRAERPARRGGGTRPLALALSGLFFVLAASGVAGRSALADEAAPARSAASDSERLRRLEEALERESAARRRLEGDFARYREENPASDRLTQAEVSQAVDAYLSASPGGGVPVLSTAAAPSGLRWGGYLNLEYHAPSDGVSYFDLHRLILSFDAAIAPRIDFSAEVEFEHGGVSDEIEGEIVVEKAEVIFRQCDAFNPKFGWVLVPFGRFNSQHDDPINDFTVRPFTARYLVPTGFGQPGIGVEGAMPFGCGHVFSYDVALTNGYRDAFNAEEGVREARQAEDENDGKQAWGRAFVRWETPGLDTLETGVSLTYGLYDAREKNAVKGVALDALVRKGPFEVKGEYVAYDYDRNSLDPADAVRGQNAIWLEAGWHFFPEAFCGGCEPLVTDTSLFTLLVRYQHMDLDDRATGATFEDDLTAWSVGLNYRITERTVFRVDHTWFLPEEGRDETEWTFSFATYF